MLINLTNHPSALWSAKQTETANREFGEIVDIPFPLVSPLADEKDIKRIADEYANKILATAAGREVTVHVMGEMTFTVLMVRRLQAAGITCVASTTERLVEEQNGGVKVARFEFVKFRRYI